MIIYLWEKTVLSGLITVVRSVFHEGNKYYSYVFWSECFYKLIG